MLHQLGVTAVGINIVFQMLQQSAHFEGHIFLIDQERPWFIVHDSMQLKRGSKGKLRGTMSKYWLEKSSMSATTENSRTRKAMSLIWQRSVKKSWVEQQNDTESAARLA